MACGTTSSPVTKRLHTSTTVEQVEPFSSWQPAVGRQPQKRAQEEYVERARQVRSLMQTFCPWFMGVIAWTPPPFTWPSNAIVVLVNPSDRWSPTGAPIPSTFPPVAGPARRVEPDIDPGTGVPAVFDPSGRVGSILYRPPQQAVTLLPSPNHSGVYTFVWKGGEWVCSATIRVSDEPDDSAPEWTTPPKRVAPTAALSDPMTSEWRMAISEPGYLVVWLLGEFARDRPRRVISSPSRSGGVNVDFPTSTALNDGSWSWLVEYWLSGSQSVVVRPLDLAGHLGTAWRIDPLQETATPLSAAESELYTWAVLDQARLR